MKPETNLYLRSLVGREKSRLERQIDEILQTPGLSVEGGNQLVAALTEKSKCNDALTALRKGLREQPPIPAPSLSPESIMEIRCTLRENARVTELSVEDVQNTIKQSPGFPGLVELLNTLQRHRDLARRALDEFNAVYPEEK